MLGDLTQQSARGGSERSRWLLSASGSAPGLALSSVPDHAPGSDSGLPPRRCPRRPLRCCPPSAPSSAPSSARPGFVGTAPRQSGRAEATRVSCVWRSSSKSRTLADLALVSAPVSALPFVPDHASGSASMLTFAPLPAPTSALPSALHAVLRTVLAPSWLRQQISVSNWEGRSTSAEPSHCQGGLRQQQQDSGSLRPRQREGFVARGWREKRR